MESTILPVPGRIPGVPAAGPPPPAARNVPDFGELLAQILGPAASEPGRTAASVRSQGQDRPAKPANGSGPERDAAQRPEAPADRSEAEPRDAAPDGVTSRADRPAPHDRPEKPEAPGRADRPIDLPVDQAQPAPVSGSSDDEPPIDVPADDATAPVEVGQKGAPNPVARGPLGLAPVVPALEVLTRLFPGVTAQPAGAADQGPVLPVGGPTEAKPATPATPMPGEGKVETPVEGQVASNPFDRPIPSAQPAHPLGKVDGTPAEPKTPASEGTPSATPVEDGSKQPAVKPQTPVLGETSESSTEDGETLLPASARAAGEAPRSFENGRPVEDPFALRAAGQGQADDASNQGGAHADPRGLPAAIQAAAKAAAQASASSSSSGNGSEGPSAQTGPSSTPAGSPATPAEAARNAGPERAASQAAARSDAPYVPIQAEAIERIARMAKVTRSGERSTARVWLRPPELGTVRVTVTVDRGVVTANLSVETAAARQALISELPQLSHMLEQQGMKLGGLDVGFFGGNLDQEADRNVDKELRDRGSDRRSGDSGHGTGDARSRREDEDRPVQPAGHIGLDSVDLWV